MMMRERLNLHRQLLQDMESEQSLAKKFLKAMALYSLTRECC